MRTKVIWRSLGAEQSLARSHPGRIEPVQSATGNENLAGLSCLGKARGDVYINAEVVASDLPGASQVDARPKARRVAIDLDRRNPLTPLKRCVGRAVCVSERTHEPIAETLYDLAAPAEDRRLDCIADFAQQPNRKLVASLQGPGREADQVCEQDGEIYFSAPAALGLGQSLPPLEHRRAHLSHYARLFGPKCRELAKSDVDGAPLRHREPIVDPVVAHRQHPCSAGGAHERRVAIELAKSRGKSLPARMGATDGHQRSLNQEEVLPLLECLSAPEVA
jgi:hypothetical protein